MATAKPWLWITLWDSMLRETAYYNSPSLFKNRERVPAKGYISDQLTDEAIGVVDRAKTLDQPFMLYLAYNAPHLPNDNPAPEQYQKQFNTGSQTADNYYASVYSVDQGVKRILEQLKKTDSMTIQLFSLPPIMVQLSMVLCR
ncbi:sulfatase ydeN [Escherichia coli]|uniref:Sulfatase ydeN n=1 Tax=Escherichia coli TaxID=562 RepID=A0A377K6U0_ECOLX|nr:sulfatase ydeN [Escherichia coli]